MLCLVVKKYTSAPDLDLVGIGTGIGGKLRAIVTDGKITDVKVLIRVLDIQYLLM